MNNKHLEKLISLGHSVTQSRLYRKYLYQSNFEGWFECIKCNVKVYIRRENNNFKLYYWQNDIFKTKNFCGRPNSVVEFNLTCDEVIVLKIID